MAAMLPAMRMLPIDVLRPGCMRIRLRQLLHASCNERLAG
jgi:hypothetical protein